MKNVVFSIIFCFVSIGVKSEVMILPSTFDLCMYSDRVVEAELVKIEDELFVFTYKLLGNNNDQIKQLKLTNLSELYDIEEAQQNRKDYQQLTTSLNAKDLNLVGFDTVSIDNADRIIMFLTVDNEDSNGPKLNGLRLIKNNLIYTPTQKVSSGKEFVPKPSWLVTITNS